MPPAHSAACTIWKPIQHPAAKPSASFSCCLGNVFFSAQKDLETQSTRSTMQKAERPHLLTRKRPFCPVVGLGRRSAMLCCSIQKRELGCRAAQRRSGELINSNSCTVMTLGKHLAHGFHPITQACLWVKQLFLHPALLQRPGERDPKLAGGHARAGSLLPPATCAAGSGSMFVPLFWFVTNKQSAQPPLQT